MSYFTYYTSREVLFSSVGNLENILKDLIFFLEFLFFASTWPQTLYASWNGLVLLFLSLPLLWLQTCLTMPGSWRVWDWIQSLVHTKQLNCVRRPGSYLEITLQLGMAYPPSMAHLPCGNRLALLATALQRLKERACVCGNEHRLVVW